MDLSVMVGQYIKLRDRVAEMKAEFTKSVEPFNSAMADLENAFMEQMQQLGLDSLKTSEGTAYQAMQTSVTTADRNAFLAFLLETQAWHLLDIRAAKVAVSEAVEGGEPLPPGLNMTKRLIVNVRRT
jgi:hypothetical protein